MYMYVYMLYMYNGAVLDYSGTSLKRTPLEPRKSVLLERNPFQRLKCFWFFSLGSYRCAPLWKMCALHWLELRPYSGVLGESLHLRGVLYERLHCNTTRIYMHVSGVCGAVCV